MKPTITISEWRTGELLGGELTTADEVLVTRLAKDRKIQIDALKSGLRIQAFSWIGVIELSQCIIQIEPKLAGGAAGLVEMLTYTRGIDGLKRYENQRTLHPDQASGLFDLLALLFAESCEKVVRRGLLHDYMQREATLPVLRGRLRVAEQVRQHFGRIDTLECRYDDHTSDIIENRLLAHALTTCLTHVTHPAIRRRISRLQTTFTHATKSTTLDYQRASQLIWNRMNAHYKDAHTLGWLILKGLQVHDLLASGHTNSFAFLLNMNTLFEDFVAHLVRELVGKTFVVKAQSVRQSSIWDVERKRSYQQIRPDLVLESAEKRVVIDAKYKLYDKKKIASSDIYQAFLYAHAFASDPTYLFYPASSNSIQTTHLEIRDWQQIPSATVIGVGLPLPQLLAELRENGISVIQQVLRTLLQSNMPTEFSSKNTDSTKTGYLIFDTTTQK